MRARHAPHGRPPLATHGRNPSLYRLDEKRNALVGLRGLALDYGIGDQFLHIPTATAEVSRTLAELRIPHLLDVYEGDHRQQLSERLETTVFPWVGRRLVTR